MWLSPRNEKATVDNYRVTSDSKYINLSVKQIMKRPTNWVLSSWDRPKIKNETFNLLPQGSWKNKCFSTSLLSKFRTFTPTFSKLKIILTAQRMGRKETSQKFKTWRWFQKLMTACGSSVKQKLPLGKCHDIIDVSW